MIGQYRTNLGKRRAVVMAAGALALGAAWAPAAAEATPPSHAHNLLAANDLQSDWANDLLSLLDLLCILFDCDGDSTANPTFVGEPTTETRVLAFITNVSSREPAPEASLTDLAAALVTVDDARLILVLAPWVLSDPVRQQLDATLLEVRGKVFERMQP